MKFLMLPRVYPKQPIWGVAKGPFTFVITQDEPAGFTASAKVVGALKFDGTRHDLGGYAAHKTFDEAKTACKQFYKERNG